MSFISAIGLAVPQNKFEQSQISAFMERLASNEEIKKRIQTVFRASGIKARHSVLKDYGKNTDFEFYPNNETLDPFPGTSMRMQEFRKHAITLSLEAVSACRDHNPFELEEITHVITVSCTGMYAPGLDIDLVNQLPLKTSVSRTGINFMGCFAAISALKAAHSFCSSDPAARVLIVCTELCSLHFQKEFTDDNILSNALFADGSAAVLVEASKRKGASFEIESSHSEILASGKSHMAWTIGDLGFEMRLSAYVPDVLSQGISALVGTLAKKAGVDESLIKHFAIHPGGKKILESVATQLGLSKTQLGPSYKILQDYGNMSSPAVLFVLKKILEGQVSEGDRILTLAFGPGITVESMLLKAV
jgi:alpha-pyrone synthase